MGDAAAPEPLARGDHIIAAVTAWDGITTRPGDYGETEFMVDGRMIGHVHGDWQADIPFPRRIRDELVASGRAEPHHIHPKSTWTTRYIRTDGDADDVIDLLRINYDRVTTSERRARRS
jgi:hypothetical protein